MTLPDLWVISLAISIVATPLAMVVARRTGIMDHPGDLKSQTDAVPYLGGAAVFCGLVLSMALGKPLVIVPVVAALALGTLDDRFQLPALLRLVGEFVIGAGVAWVAPVHEHGLVGRGVVVLVTVLLINGVNLMDGQDGLAGGVCAIAAGGFAVVAASVHFDVLWVQQVAIGLVGALLGFLAFNRPAAQIYLGDGGSYLLGTVLAVMLAGMWSPHHVTGGGLAAVGLVLVPLAELGLAILRRLRGRRSPLAGDRGHPYDRLVQRGWSPRQSTLVYLVTALVVAVAVDVAVQFHQVFVMAITDGVLVVLLIVLAAWAGGLTPDPKSATDDDGSSGQDPSTDDAETQRTT